MALKKRIIKKKVVKKKKTTTQETKPTTTTTTKKKKKVEKEKVATKKAKTTKKKDGKLNHSHANTTVTIREDSGSRFRLGTKRQECFEDVVAILTRKKKGMDIRDLRETAKDSGRVLVVVTSHPEYFSADDKGFVKLSTKPPKPQELKPKKEKKQKKEKASKTKTKKASKKKAKAKKK